MGFVKDTFFGGAEKKAGQAQERAARESTEFQREQLDVQRTEAQRVERVNRLEARRAEGIRREDVGLAIGELRPFTEQEAGLSLQRQQALSGALGAEAQSQAFTEFQESPNVAFLREQGLRQIGAGAGAGGGLGGGDRLRELTKFSQGLALQDLEGQFGRLGATALGEEGVLSRRQQAAGGIAGLQAGRSGDFRSGAVSADVGGLISGISGGIQGIGAAQAATKLGKAAGARAGVQQVASGVVGGLSGGLSGVLQGGFGV